MVDGLGTHDIIGKGTVEYTVIDDNDRKCDIVIYNTTCVPILDVRLISAQQFIHVPSNTEGIVKATHFLLKWGKFINQYPTMVIVTYQYYIPYKGLDWPTPTLQNTYQNVISLFM